MTVKMFNMMCGMYSTRTVVRVMNKSVRALAKTDTEVCRLYNYWMGVFKAEEEARKKAEVLAKKQVAKAEGTQMTAPRDSSAKRKRFIEASLVYRMAL